MKGAVTLEAWLQGDPNRQLLMEWNAAKGMFHGWLITRTYFAADGNPRAIIKREVAASADDPYLGGVYKKLAKQLRGAIDWTALPSR